MSLSYQQHVVVTENDVLCGRGVNIACHPGNERFRTLVNTRADDTYCTSYSASEKRAVAEEIIHHIQSLDPPGRFLKREGRGRVSRGLNGPWEILTDREAIKKTCQALRDCNRMDRAGYANGVLPPEDVIENAEKRTSTGLTGRQHAQAAAAASAAAAAAAASATLKRTREQMLSSGTASPSAVAAVTATLNEAASALPNSQDTSIQPTAHATLTEETDAKRLRGPMNHYAHHHLDPHPTDVPLALGTGGMLDDTPLPPPPPAPSVAVNGAAVHHQNGVVSIISEPSPAPWAPDPATTTSPGDVFITAPPHPMDNPLDTVIVRPKDDVEDEVTGVVEITTDGALHIGL